MANELNGMVIRVAGNDYDVQVTPTLATAQGLWGLCSYGVNTISSAQGIEGDRANNTLIHEMTHAIFFEAGFIDHEEDMVNRVANVLHQVLRDNDFGFLRDEDEEDCGDEVKNALEATY
jgi:hypothetical protein